MEKITEKLIILIEGSDLFSTEEKSFWKHLVPALDLKIQKEFNEVILSGQKSVAVAIQKNSEKIKKIKNRHIQEWEKLIVTENKKTMKLVEKKIKDDDVENIKKIYDQLKIN